MLTFEEFFAKKKIDLALLKEAEPVLFSEFENEFEQMGEKSFDHTKKFWFNKIRRAYHLKEAPKPAKTVIEITKIASQAEPLSSPTIAQNPIGLFTDDREPKSPEQAESLPKPAFKPRFKPGLVKSAASVEESQKPLPEQPLIQAKHEEREISTVDVPVSKEKEITDNGNAVPKPVYKPRFKAQKNNNPIEHTDKETDNLPTQPAEEPKKEEQIPSYKPRFNARLTNSKPDTDTNDT